MTDYIINPTNAKIQIDATVDTLVHVLVDASYSMNKIRSHTHKGLNEYLNGIPKSKENSRTLVSITAFDSDSLRNLRLKSIRSYVDVNDLSDLTESEYVPDGGTPLRDAAAAMIEETDAVARTSPTPPAVLFVIVTDGEENASTKIKSNAELKALIETKTNEDKWTFVFLGANQDAFEEGQSYGIARGNTVNFAAGAVDSAFKTVADVTSSYTMSNSIMRSTLGKSAKFETARGFADAGYDNTKDIDK